jgi:hypothetical protein
MHPDRSFFSRLFAVSFVTLQSLLRLIQMFLVTMLSALVLSMTELEIIAVVMISI